MPLHYTNLYALREAKVPEGAGKRCRRTLSTRPHHHFEWKRSRAAKKTLKVLQTFRVCG